MPEDIDYEKSEDGNVTTTKIKRKFSFSASSSEELEEKLKEEFGEEEAGRAISLLKAHRPKSCINTGFPPGVIGEGKITSVETPLLNFKFGFNSDMKKEPPNSADKTPGVAFKFDFEPSIGIKRNLKVLKTGLDSASAEKVLEAVRLAKERMRISSKVPFGEIATICRQLGGSSQSFLSAVEALLKADPEVNCISPLFGIGGKWFSLRKKR